MPEQMTPSFVQEAAYIIADTTDGLSATEFHAIVAAYAAEWRVALAHPTTPFTTTNKRTALYQNLLEFSQEQRYKIIHELCEHPKLLEKCAEKARVLKMKLAVDYGHLGSDEIASGLDAEIVTRTQHILSPYKGVLNMFNDAVRKHAADVFDRNFLDDLRLALELLVKDILNNQKSLEKQKAPIADYLKDKDGSIEISNMFVQLIDYYAVYQNAHVKHKNDTRKAEIEFVFELTTSFMKHFARLAQQ